MSVEKINTLLHLFQNDDFHPLEIAWAEGNFCDPASSQHLYLKGGGFTGKKERIYTITAKGFS